MYANHAYVTSLTHPSFTRLKLCLNAGEFGLLCGKKTVRIPLSVSKTSDDEKYLALFFGNA